MTRPRPRPASPPSRVGEDTTFKGMDARSPSERLAPGFAQRIENMCVGVGGDLISRPPLIGQFASPLPGPIFSAPESKGVFLTSSGETRLVFGCTNGKLYYTLPGATAPVEITKSGGASANVSRSTYRGDRYGKFYFFLDANGNPCRTDTTSADVVTGLDAPTVAPTAQLTSRVLNAFNLPYVWAADSGTNPGNQVSDPAFASSTVGTTANATSSPNAITGWTVTSGSVTVYGADKYFGAGKHYILLQEAGTTIRTSAYFTMPAVTNGNGVGSAARYEKHVVLRVTGWFGQPNDSATLQAVGYTTTDGTGTEYITTAYPAQSTNAGERNIPLVRAVTADFSGFGVEIRTVRLQAVAGAGNALGAEGPYFTAFYAAPFELPVTFSGNDNGLTVYGNLPNATNPTLPIGGKILSIDLAPSGLVADRVDFSNYGTLTIPFSSNNFADTATAPRFRLGFRATGAATRYTTNLVTFAEDLSGFSVDITSIPAANRNNVRYLDLVFDSDTPLANALSAGQNALFSLGALTDAGRLSVIEGIGYPYNWLYAFFDADTGATGDYGVIAGIESSGSPQSNTLTPTTMQAQALVKVPNTPPANVTHIVFYRKGGTLGNGEAPLLAFVPVDTNVTSATGFSWDFASRTLLDNVPDSTLLSAVYFYKTGRDKPPANCTDLTVHDNRLWLVSGNTLYASWKLDESDANALYFTQVALPTDPEVYSKGDAFKLASSSDGDKILGLTTFGTTMQIFRQGGHSVLSGDNPTNWSVNPTLKGAGTGLVARNGYCSPYKSARLWFLATDGIAEYGENDAPLVAEQLTPLLSGSVLDATTYANVSLCAHGQNVFAFAGNFCYVYTYDRANNINGWVVWTGTPFNGATGAISVAASGTPTALYVCGGDGQLYKMAGRYGEAVSGGDKTTPGASVTTINTVFKTRKYPAPDKTEQTPNALLFDVSTMNGAGQQFTWTIATQTGTTPATGPYTFSGRARRRLESVGFVKGVSQDVSLSAAVVEPFRVFGAGLVFSGGEVRNG